jgi:protein-disulfide isomerase
MTPEAIRGGPQSAGERLDAADHVRGPKAGRLLLEYGDYECPYSRQAYREIKRVEQQLDGGLRFAFRHFPLEDIHPYARGAAAAAEAAALQDRFWEMHDLLFRRARRRRSAALRRRARARRPPVR